MSLMVECFRSLSSLCLRLLLACVGRRVSPFALHPPLVGGSFSRRLWICIGTWCALEHARGSYSRHRRNRERWHLVCHRGSCGARHCGQREVPRGTSRREIEKTRLPRHPGTIQSWHDFSVQSLQRWWLTGKNQWIISNEDAPRLLLG